ncbi:peptidylprolyl isomerase [Neisseriaceae bacterium TC5R-5]|nr:peptidylprolyl isomerase [Neisseriaceae bacterium TC5R-5]
MKKTLLSLFVASAILSMHSPVFAADPSAVTTTVREVDRIVAIVNKSAITWLDLQRRVAEAAIQLELQKVPLPAKDILQRQVLEQMITEEVQLQYANSIGIRIEDAAVEQAMTNLAKQNGLDLAGFKAKVAKDGLSLDWLRGEIRKELIISRLRDSEVGSRVTVNDTEVEHALKSAQNNNLSEFLLSSILISVPEQADTKTIDGLAKKAERALADLNAGQSFAKVAASYSDAPNALKGGDMGWRGANSLPPEFVNMLEQLPKGQHTNIIRTPQGFFIFQLQNKRDGKAPLMVAQYHVSHILVRTTEAVSDSEAKTRIEQIRDRLLQGAQFADMAKLYSEDGSKTKGGDLGWVNLGDMVPAFENAMTRLPVGEVSQPVRSPFGWHLILVDAKRNQDVSADREKMLIRQQIQARKMEQAYTDWVRQLRDSAFVEERLDDK